MPSRRTVGAGLLAAFALTIACGDSERPAPSASPSPQPSPSVCTPPSPTPTPDPPPPATFVYLTNPEAGTISGFGMDRSSGALTALAGPPMRPTGGRPASLTIDSQRRVIHVGLRDGPDALVTYSIDAWTGTLTPVPCSGQAAPPVAELPGRAPHPGERLTSAGIISHPDGHLAYVTFDYYCDDCICGVEAWIWPYTVDAATRRLVRTDLPPVLVGRAGLGDTPPEGLSTASAIAGSYLYATNRGSPGGVCPINSELSTFAVDSASGGLRRLYRQVPMGSPNDGDGHLWLLLPPSADVLYLARQQDTLQYEIKKATGALELKGTSPRVGPALVSPAGRLYSAVGVDDAPGVRAFEIEPSTRALVPVSHGFAATRGPVGSLAIDSSGRFLCAVQSEVGTLSVFTIDAATGRPQPVPGPPTIVGSDRYDPELRIVAIADIQ